MEGEHDRRGAIIMGRAQEKNQRLGEQEEERTVIQDHTETDLVSLRRTIYQTIMSTLNFEEAGHKLLQIRLEPGQEMEICVMILECCAEEKTYRPFYEEDTTYSSRIFLKILFQELCEQIGLRALSEKLQDPTMEETFESIFPKDHPKNMRFSIDFFTSIGLGDITEKLRQLLIKRQRINR
ncbi:hypothetical protein HID58_019869 [Brassica napus]|uniref:MI domain-containing protein n=1 Tax=Brassica napus TaxID=3708 RepID=A0ABQ8DE34_BRANA|nr:hypothetical protein HID58_019869 [Brassica napus]